MIKVFGISPAHSGFGLYQCSVEGSEYDYDSATEYADAVSVENHNVKGWVSSDTIAASESSIWDDEDMKRRLIDAVESATDAVQGGHGIIVAFMVNDEIQLESVDVI